MPDPVGRIREATDSEREFFRKNKSVSAYASPDDSVVFNPHLNLSPKQKQSLTTNERTRIALRNHYFDTPSFSLTSDQKKRFKNYSPDMNDVRATITARIIANDPSTGATTTEQRDFANKMKASLSSYYGR